MEVHVDEFLTSALHGGELIYPLLSGHFAPGERTRPQKPVNVRFFVSQGQSGRFRKRERILPLPGIEPHLFGRSSHTLVHIPTAVFSSHLHFPHKKGT